MKTMAGILCTILAFSLSISAIQAQHGPSVFPANTSLKAASKIAPDIQSRALWDGRKEVEFHAATLPKMVKAADAHFLIDNEYVLGITKNGESRAYPTRFVSWHHIINDRIGTTQNGEPSYVTVTYCIVCNSGICFETPLLQHKPLQFDFYGLYNGVMTLYDRNTESVWLQVSGRAVKGPLCEMTLTPAPLLDTTWRAWKRLHPNTLVMAPDPHFTSCYESKGSIMVRGYTAFPADYFRPTLTHRDVRLPMFEPVLAVSLPAVETDVTLTNAAELPMHPPALHRAYPMNTFKKKTGVVNDMLGTTPVAILFRADTETVNAVSPVVDGRTLTLEARKIPEGKFAFFDRETGSRWNIEGRAEAGPLLGKALSRIDSHMSQWYGWVAYFPETTIYGQPDPSAHALHPTSPLKIGRR
ncbi:MAG: hypothetical protein JWL77_3036 [Chthonomonadaceae bacterium]|nr:hypothetical protein [Chthonomonadaceae bacterium]